MRIDILTIFPKMFAGPFDESTVHRAIEREIVSLGIHDLRDWTADRHRTVDDSPFGGGPGMVMKAVPVVAAAESILDGDLAKALITSPAGRLFDQEFAEELATEPRLLIVCGHYEGIDDRARQVLHAEEVSIGDYVLTGGELAAMVIVDAVVRLLPGVITAESLDHESHSDGLLEGPQFTRPAEFRGLMAPDVLLSGNHSAVAAWRRQQAILRTAARRPDLLDTAELTPKEWAWLTGQDQADL